MLCFASHQMEKKKYCIGMLALTYQLQIQSVILDCDINFFILCFAALVLARRKMESVFL